MRPQTKDVSVTSNIQGETIKMGIDSSSLVHIMDVLSNLYKDPEGSVIRELSTNALDATIEAGVDAPIEVTLPNRLSNSLVITDHGVGMSFEDVRNVYSKYGTSTRRDSDDFVGSLGLGSKSPFTLTSQFTVSSVKDGKHILVFVSRDATGVGSMQLVSELDTDKPNGTTITVPYSGRHENMQAKAEGFFQFWPSGSVLLNGKPNVSGKTYWLEYEEDIYLSSDGYAGPNYIVMGNVPYPVDLGQERGIVHYAKMGVVDFAPSREQLYMSARTIAYVDQLRSRVQNAHQKAMNKGVDKQKNHTEAYYFYMKQPLRHRTELIYKGRDFKKTTRSSVERGVFSWTINSRYSYEAPYVSNSHTNGGKDNLLVITGYKNSQLNKDQREKVKIHALGMDPAPSSFLFMENDVEDVWFEGYRRESWDTIKKTKLPAKTPSGRTRKTPGPDQFLQIADNTTTDLDPKKDILYSVSSMSTLRYRFRDFKEFLKGAQFRQIRRSNLDKFLVKYPNAKEFNEYLTAKADDIIAKTDDKIARMYRAERYSSDDNYAKLIVGAKDPKIIEMSKILGVNRTPADIAKLEELRLAILVSQSHAARQMHTRSSSDNQLRQYLHTNYPLTSSIQIYSCKNADFVEYLNHHYETTIKPKTTNKGN